VKNGRARCPQTAYHKESTDQNGILDNGITVGMREPDDRAPWAHSEKSKALRRPGRNVRAHIGDISELYRG